jgi:hypothetical protein
MADMVPAHSAMTVCQDSRISRSAAMAESSLCHKVIQSCASLRGSGVSGAGRPPGFVSLNPAPSGGAEVLPEQSGPAALGPPESRPPALCPVLSKPASITMLHTSSSQTGP